MNFFDKPVLYLINHSCSSRFFNFLMPLITELGSGEFLFLAALIFLYIRKKEIRGVAILLIAGLTIAYYSVGVLKILAARPRPFIVFPDIHLLVQEKGFSFPSYHTTSAFMSAVLLGSFFRPRIILYTLAALVGFSRIYIGVHFPSDVIAGAFIGIGIGYFLLTIGKSAGLSYTCPRSSVG